MIRFYRKKSITVPAIQYTIDNLNEVIKFVGVENADYCSVNEELFIRTLEGIMKVEPYAYILRGPKNEVYPCRMDVFEMTYEEVQN